MICHPSNFQIRQEGEGGEGPTILKREKQDDISVFSHAYLLLRTWAVWKRNQHLSLIFPTLFVLVWIPGFVVTFMFLNSVVSQ